MRSKRFRLAAGAASGCLAALLLTLGIAGAAERIHSKVNIKSIDPDAVKGVVTSSEEACERGRTVKLYYSAPRSRGQGEEVLIGKDKTNKKGKWQLKDGFVIGHYHAVVPKEKLGGSRLQKSKLEDDLTEVEEDEEDEEERRGSRVCSYTSDSTDE